MDTPVPILIENMTRFVTVPESRIGSPSGCLAFYMANGMIHSITVNLRWAKRLDDPDNINWTIDHLKYLIKDSEKSIKRSKERIQHIKESLSFMALNPLINSKLTLCGDVIGYRQEDSSIVKLMPATRYTIAKDTAGTQIGSPYKNACLSYPEVHSIYNPKTYKESLIELKHRIKRVEEEIKVEDERKSQWLNVTKKLKTETPDQWVWVWKR